MDRPSPVGPLQGGCRSPRSSSPPRMVVWPASLPLAGGGMRAAQRGGSTACAPSPAGPLWGGCRSPATARGRPPPVSGLSAPRRGGIPRRAASWCRDEATFPGEQSLSATVRRALSRLTASSESQARPATSSCPPAVVDPGRRRAGRWPTRPASPRGHTNIPQRLHHLVRPFPVHLCRLLTAFWHSLVVPLIMLHLGAPASIFVPQSGIQWLYSFF
jgi:hypothetical protein